MDKERWGGKDFKESQRCKENHEPGSGIVIIIIKKIGKEQAMEVSVEKGKIW